MNTLDIILLILFIPGLIRGMSKGFIEQAVSLVGIVLSVYLAFRFSSGSRITSPSRKRSSTSWGLRPCWW